MGKMFAGLTAVLGLVLMIIGLSTVAPISGTLSPAMSNPSVPFAAGIWVLGLIVMLMTPVANLSGSKE